jgi:hypothetical protein
MNHPTPARQQQGLFGTLAVLLLAAACGGNEPPTLVEGTQSATSVQSLETVTLRVTAKDDESAALRFS